MLNFTKTIKLCLYVTSEQEVLFRQMMEQFCLACNLVSEHIFGTLDLSYQSLNKKLYRDIRNQFGLMA